MLHEPGETDGLSPPAVLLADCESFSYTLEVAR